MSDRKNNRSGRQVVYLFLGFLILFVLTFSLGVIVGKGLSESETRMVRGESPPKTSRKEVKEPEKTSKIITGEKLSVEQTPAFVEQKAESETAKIEEEKTPPPLPIEEPIEVEIGEETTKKDIAAMPPTEPGGKYTVQIGAFQKEEEAKKITESLKLKGYPAFVKPVEIPGKGTWYRVRIGTFKTGEEAKLYGEHLKSSEPSIESVFITVNN